LVCLAPSTAKRWKLGLVRVCLEKLLESLKSYLEESRLSKNRGRQRCGMSVADYIKDHYGPYMCSTGRHKWVLFQEPTEEVDGFCVCSYCYETWDTPFLALVHYGKRQERHILPLIDIMPERNTIFNDVPYVKEGVA